MPKYNFRILLETIEGNKSSYYSSSFVDTSTDTLSLTSAQVYNRITGSISASYQNQTIFSGSDYNTNFTFKDNTLLSASLQGSSDTGSIVFTALDSEYDRLLRYKFIGEKVCNTLGLPSDQWVYVDQIRLPVDDEANIFQGNANLGNVFITDNLTFAGGSDINSDVPILIDTGSDRYVKFVDERGISEVALRMGYDVDADVYEISGSDDFTFNIGGVNNIKGDVTGSGLFSFHKNVDGGSSVITIANTNRDSGTDKFSGIEFKHGGTNALGGTVLTNPAGKILAGKDSNYIFGATNQDSNLQFFTALNGTDTERLRIDSNGLATFTGRISASGDIITNGNVIAENYIVSSTVTQITTSFSSGSTIFGDDSNDIHQFTGSVNITGSLNLPDNTKAIFGDGDDLQIYHDGTDAFITDAGGTHLKIHTNQLQVKNAAGNEELIKATQNDGVKLFHNNNQKFETMIGGIEVTGHITASGNISASGIITAEGLVISDDVEITDDLTVNGDIDLEGNIDVNGTANLDNVDIDGAVDMASRLTIAGHITSSNNISSSGTIISNVFNAIQGGNASAQGLRFDNRTDQGIFGHGFFTSVMAPESITMHIDSNNNGTTEYFNVVKDQKLVGQTTNELFRVQEDGNVGIGTSSPPKTLTVQGDISASGNLFITGDTNLGTIQLTNITASGDISSSGTIIASKFQSTGGSGELINFNDNLSVIGHITASGNISASGTSHTFGGDVSIGNDLTLPADGIINFGSDNAQIKGSTGALDLIHSQTNFESGIRLDTQGHIEFATVHNNNLDFDTDTRMIISMSGADGTAKVGIGNLATGTSKLQVTGDITATHITASGNISSSGNISATGNLDIDGTSNFADDITIAENKAIFFDSTDTFIKANTGNPEDLVISADEDIILAPDDNIQIEHGATTYAEFMGDERKLSITGEISASAGVTTSHITASGNISASGTIESTGNITTDGELSADTIVVGSTISHIGDTNTLISFGTDTLTFKAGNEAFITITEDGSQDNIVIGDGGDIDFHVKAGGDNTLFAQGSSQRIGIGTATPTSKLQVVGDITATHITASGNISASGDIFANEITLTGASAGIKIEADGGTELISTGTAGAFNITSAHDLYLLAASGKQVRIGSNNTNDEIRLNKGHITASGNISASGTQHIFGGSVGIGDADPPQALSVVGNILLQPNAENDSFIHANNDLAISSDAGVLIVADTNDTSGVAVSDIIFGAGSAVDTNGNKDFTFAQAYPSVVPRLEAMRIKGDTQNVGIGTTTPTVALQVTGNISSSGAINTLSHITASGNISASGNVLTSGKIGIGTTSPTELLEIRGDSDPTLVIRTATAANNANSGKISFREAGDTERANLRYDGSANKFRIDMESNAGALVIKKSDGFTGLGTENPTTRLQVEGNISSSGQLTIGKLGSTNGHITASGNYSGSATSTFRIGGKLIAGSKSFVIPRPGGGSLEYGVLEGQQNDVFFRGKLKGDNVIYLPQEWEWLVDDNTITVQLTSIGKHQELFVKEIKENKIFIDINGMFKTKENIHCYHIIHGTRKDIELIRNYQ